MPEPEPRPAKVHRPSGGYTSAPTAQPTLQATFTSTQAETSAKKPQEGMIETGVSPISPTSCKREPVCSVNTVVEVVAACYFMCPGRARPNW